MHNLRRRDELYKIWAFRLYERTKAENESNAKAWCWETSRKTSFMLKDVRKSCPDTGMPSMMVELTKVMAVVLTMPTDAVLIPAALSHTTSSLSHMPLSMCMPVPKSQYATEQGGRERGVRGAFIMRPRLLAD